MPSVTVKAYAELIHTPMYGQMRILQEQKYPAQTAGQFKIKYYEPALKCIRRHYRQTHPLPANGQQIPSCGNRQDRIDHNLRVINAFRNGSQAARQLAVSPNQTFDLNIATMTIRATPDLIVTEGGGNTVKYIVYDCRCVEPVVEVARTTVELLHHILSQNGIGVHVRDIEYVCLDNDLVLRWNTVRQRTIQRAQATAAGIASLWDAI